MRAHSILDHDVLDAGYPVLTFWEANVQSGIVGSTTSLTGVDIESSLLHCAMGNSV